MGLKKKRNNVTYLQIREGQIIKRLKEASETSVERKITKGKNEGQIVHEERFDAIEGLIIGLYKREAEVPFQKEPLATLEIVMKDVEDESIFQITVPFSSAYTRGLMTRIEKIDLSVPIEFCTYWIEGDDKKYRGFVGIHQYGEKVEALYSHNDGIMPAVEKVKVGKKDVYDDSALLEFYDGILDKVTPFFEIKTSERNEDDKKSMPEPDDKTPDDEEGLVF